jgi:endonuclease YncB( thermonuclease family)
MKQITALIALAVLVSACGGGSSGAQGTAAVETAVAEMLAAQNQAPAGETPAPEQAANSEPTATLDQNIDANLVALVNSCIPTTTTQTRATVIEVNNGDSIWVFYDNDEHEVRYIGVDAPEGGDSGAGEALSANKALVEGREVLLVAGDVDHDEYDRLLRYVVIDNTFVNLELVRQGVAFPSPEQGNNSCDNAFANAR